MTAEDFRDLALSLPEATESAHMGHPDFRVRNKIFATLDPDETRGMAKLTPEQQALSIQSRPDVFQAVQGAWGRRGCTYVRLEIASKPEVLQVLVAAWQNTAPKRLARQLDGE